MPMCAWRERGQAEVPRLAWRAALALADQDAAAQLERRLARGVPPRRVGVRLDQQRDAPHVAALGRSKQRPRAVAAAGQVGLRARLEQHERGVGVAVGARDEEGGGTERVGAVHLRPRRQ